MSAPAFSGQDIAVAEYLTTLMHLSLWEWMRGVTEEVCLLHEMAKRAPPGIPERIVFPGLGMGMLASFHLLHRRGPNSSDALGGDFALSVARRTPSTVVWKHAFIQLKVARFDRVGLKSSQIASAQPVINHSFIMAAIKPSRRVLVTPTSVIRVPPGENEFAERINSGWLEFFFWACSWLSCQPDPGTSDAIENTSATLTTPQVIAPDPGTSDAIENSSATLTTPQVVAPDPGTSDAIELSSATLTTPQVIAPDPGASNAIENSSATLVTPLVAIDGGTGLSAENNAVSLTLLIPPRPLYPSYPTKAPALSKRGIRNYAKGMFQLITGNQQNNFPGQPAITQDSYSGYSFRELWKVVEPNPVDVTQPGWQNQLNWTNLDNCVNAVRAVGKYCGISIFAGKNSPSWLAAPPFNCQQFLINSIASFTNWDPSVTYVAGQVVYYLVDGRYYNALDTSLNVPPGSDDTIWDKIGAPILVNAPWDPTFIQRWTYIIQAFGQRYDGDPTVAYVVISGPGTGDAEAYVAKNLNDLAVLNAPPINGIKPWVDAVKGFYQSFIDAFPNTPVVYVSGPPIPYNSHPGFIGTQPTSPYLAGNLNAFQISSILTAFAVGSFGRHWGIRSSGLRGNYNLNSFAGQAISNLIDVVGLPHIYRPFFCAGRTAILEPDQKIASILVTKCQQ